MHVYRGFLQLKMHAELLADIAYDRTFNGGSTHVACADRQQLVMSPVSQQLLHPKLPEHTPRCCPGAGPRPQWAPRLA